MHGGFVAAAASKTQANRSLAGREGEGEREIFSFLKQLSQLVFFLSRVTGTPNEDKFANNQETR